MTFTVTNTNDMGTGSLRQATLDSNANPPPPNTANLIQFNIPGSGVHTIGLGSSLPDITQPVIIDGYTQPGATPNTLAIGDNALLLIRIDGGTIGTMLRLCDPSTCGGSGSSDGSTIRGLCIVNNGGGRMIDIESNNNLVAGNFVGVDTDGTTVVSNGTPILITSGVSGNTVGGTSPADRNVIASDIGQGTLTDIGGNNTLVQGSYFGVNAAGTAAIGSAQNAIVIETGSGTTIGGNASGAGNVINATNIGVQIAQVNFFFPLSNHTVQGNLIGTDATGTIALHALVYGINLGTAESTTIGGSAVGAGNVINAQADGIRINISPTNLVIQGNKIGTDINGAPLGNGGCGIEVLGDTMNGLIGGLGAGQGNIIAFNGTNGISVSSNNTGWAILGNSIFDNARLGVTLQGCGANTATPNDDCDTDNGPNNLQNYPVITSASFSNGNVTVSGNLNSVPNTMFRIEFFSSASCDLSGFGQGQTFIGSTMVTTDGSCNANFGPLTFPIPLGEISAFSRKTHGSAGTFDVLLPLVVTTTATRLDANMNPIETSEFSACASQGTDNIGIECRTGPTFQMIIHFATNVTVQSASVTSGTGMVSNFSGNGTPVITVNLAGVTNEQRITVTLHNVNNGSSSGEVPVSMGVLAGDTNANGTVNAADVSQTKSRLGQAVDSTNFRSDVNANGTVNAGDVSIVKSHLGSGLP